MLFRSIPSPRQTAPLPNRRRTRLRQRIPICRRKSYIHNYNKIPSCRLNCIADCLPLCMKNSSASSAVHPRHHRGESKSYICPPKTRCLLQVPEYNPHPHKSKYKYRNQHIQTHLYIYVKHCTNPPPPEKHNLHCHKNPSPACQPRSRKLSPDRFCPDQTQA